ncbi:MULTISPECIES: hypothetical protein [Proteus]|uniref:Uncharacterized protein n=1 Tax=Proteus vulgaris TaxID=585 RepID=A0A379FDK4_PROVU|nr:MULTISPECIES: hypothetical protein [Proteus]MBJ2108382.1 hypothetical protein [Proteus terrae]MBJ2131177.1 hypothetical protein [Proteus terrae]UBH61086.1 hypothetical protein LA322_13395 [Proteus vulgaris]UWU01673.1 hypothetical protein N1711_07220 [Proteus vulgaris]SUC16401.1 Uncharacterised protein [Proteus vulgaris]
MDMYGLRIKNIEDGTSFIFNESTRPASVIWSRRITGWDNIRNDETWDCPIQLPKNYSACVLGNYSAICEQIYYSDGSYYYVTGNTEEYISVDINNGVITVGGLQKETWNGRKPWNHIKIIGYPISSDENYGLRIAGNNLFLVDPPSSGFGYATFKKEITISGVFNPKDIDPSLDFDNAIYFFHSEEPNAVIRMYRNVWSDGSSIEYICINKENGNHYTAKFKVIAFQQYKLPNRKGAGLRIRNSNNEITFDSTNNVLTKPVEVIPKNIELGKEYIVNGIKKPMYIPAIVGESFYSNKGLGKFHDVIVGNYAGNSISLYSYYRHESRGTYGEYTEAISSHPLLIIDASDYFNF